MSVTIGTDPELFLRINGVLTPACGLVGGTKNRPVKVDESLYVQEDNVMLEFNVDPLTDADVWARSLYRATQHTLPDYVQSRLGGGKHVAWDREAEHVFPWESIRGIPQAMQFGCAAEFDAYSYGEPVSPLAPEALETAEGAWRFAGGHVHIGYQPSYEIPGFVAASFADLFLGLPFLRHDRQPMRRKYYGLPGRFRETSYGIEYRVMSNWWLMGGEERMFDVGSRALSLGSVLERGPESRLQRIFTEMPWGDVQLAIEIEDPELANYLLDFARFDLGLTEL